MKGHIYAFKVTDYESWKRVKAEITIDRSALRDAIDFSKPQVFEVKTERKKRSLAANAYMWVLADEIAKKISASKEEVYRRAIHDVGVFDSLSIRKDAAQRFIQGWEKNGLGWVAEIAGADMRMAYINAYYGSSAYNTEEMARLIDWLIQEAESLGIETITPKEKAMMIEDWERAHG